LYKGATKQTDAKAQQDGTWDYREKKKKEKKKGP